MTCKTCKKEKTIHEFRLQKNKKVPGGLYRNRHCFTCENTKQREYDQLPRTKVKRKFKHLKARYGLSATQYEAMLREQNSRCVICQKIMNRPHVDHNHKTNEVRGILCAPCNMYIGHIKENPEVLERAIDYLK